MGVPLKLEVFDDDAAGQLGGVWEHVRVGLANEIKTLLNVSPQLSTNVADPDNEKLPLPGLSGLVADALKFPLASAVTAIESLTVIGGPELGVSTMV